jgi:hypothetical protein
VVKDDVIPDINDDEDIPGRVDEAEKDDILPARRSNDTVAALLVARKMLCLRTMLEKDKVESIVVML